MSAALSKSPEMKIVAGQAGFFMQKGRAAFSGTSKTFALDVPFKHVSEVLAFPITSGTNATATLGTPISLNLGAISATTVLLVTVPSTGTLAANFLNSNTITNGASAFWDFGIVNKTTTLTVADRTNAHNTDSTASGSGTITAYTQFSLLMGTANTVTAGDILEVTITKNSTAGALAEASLQLTITGTGAIDKIACADALLADSTTGLIAVSGGVLNFVRESANISGMAFHWFITGTDS